MASLLTQYKNLREQYSSQLQANSLPPDSWAVFQELIYRIGVLEGFSTYVKTAPVTIEKTVIEKHFRLVDLFIGFVGVERRYTNISGDEADKRRNTADEMLSYVIDSGRRDFKGFAPKSDQSYKKCIAKYIETILCAWIQYRNTYININIMEG